MNRKHLAGATVVVWLLALGWLIQRNYVRPVSAVLAEATLRVPPGATYFAIRTGGDQIGFGASQLDTLRDTIRIQDLTVLQIPVFDRNQRVESRTSTSLTRTLELRAFETTVRVDDGRFVTRGTLSSDSSLAVDIETMDGTRTVHAPIRRPLVLPALVPLYVAFVDPAALGKSYALHLFDPVQVALRDLNLTVTAESTIVFPDSATYDSARARWEPARWDTAHAWRLSEDVAGIERHTWIDDLGQIVQAGSPVGYSVVRTAFELAFENFRSGPVSPTPTGTAGENIVHATAIAANVSLPRDELDELRVRLRHVDPASIALGGLGQRQIHDTLVIRRVEGLVEHTDGLESARGHALAHYTEPSLLIESADPRVAAQARQIVGRTTDPARIAQRLNQWVFETLDKRSTPELLSAVDVLEQRAGDCNEHTTLLVALARALGLPARRVSGLLYIQGQFYYHAWAEVNGPSWVSVDPTLGQMPVDARHIRLTTGGLAGHLELVKSLGSIRFDVIPSDGIT